MTPEQQRIAIAETCGWKHTDLSPQQDYAWTKPNGETANKRDMPDYLNDLNAIHEAEKTLEFFEEGRSYVIILDSIIRRDTDSGPKNSIGRYYFHASAAQRCETLLKAKRLWKETK